MQARNKHMLSEHLDQCQRAGILFRCSECGARFTNQLGRAKHMLRLHPTKPGASDGSKQISQDKAEVMDLVVLLLYSNFEYSISSNVTHQFSFV